MRKVSQKRHIAKTVSWRVIGTLDTMTIAWIVTGNPIAGLKIGISEVFTKMVLYYLHELIWNKFNFFRNSPAKSRKRHLVKTITWRVIGTLDTIMLSWIITGNPLAALKIGITEVVTKMILYYLHERVWYKLKFGVVEVEEGTSEAFNEKKKIETKRK